MVHASVTVRRQSNLQPVTLGWWQFGVLGAGLCIIATIVALGMGYEVADFFERRAVVAYERDFGFEVGLVRPDTPNGGTWGIARVVPGGRMARAGLRSGDVVIGAHPGGFGDLHWALREATAGRSACVAVSNVADTRAGSFTSRQICLAGTAGR